MNYRKEIDGLRAVAVVPVVLFHAGLSTFSGGYVGVDVFFVISGYLITSIIITELSEGNFSLLTFYERRARRILPALFVVMAACIPFAWAWMQADAFRNFSQSLVAVSVFGSNVLFWMQNNYFGPGAETKPLLHTWSLAVEEQYYVMFPLLLMALWGWQKQRVFLVVIFLTVLSFILCLWGVRNAPNANFYLAPFRAWELLVGSICAFMVFQRPQKPNELLSLLGLAMLVYSIVAFGEHTPFPSAYALAPVLGTALIILFSTPATFVGKLLSTKGFVGIGLISYSFYLWHQPLFAFARIKSVFAPSLSLMILLGVLSAVLAYLTWRFVEHPFRKKGAFALAEQKTIFLASLAGLVAFSALGVHGHITGGRSTGFDWGFTEQQQATLANIEEMRRTHRIRGSSQFDNGDCVFDTRLINDSVRQRIEDCYVRYGSGVLVLGDSHAIDLFGALVLNAGDAKFLVGAVNGGCRAHGPQPECMYDQIADQIMKNPEYFNRVVYEQAGFYLLEDGNGASASREKLSIPLSRPLPLYTPKSDLIAQVAAYLAPLSEVTEIIWLGPRLAPHIPVEFFLFSACDVDVQLREGQREMYQRLDAEIANLLAGTSIGYVSQSELLPFEMGSCGDLYWSDGDHFSQSGERYFGKILSVLIAG